MKGIFFFLERIVSYFFFPPRRTSIFGIDSEMIGPLSWWPGAGKVPAQFFFSVVLLPRKDSFFFFCGEPSFLPACRPHFSLLPTHDSSFFASAFFSAVLFGVFSKLDEGRASPPPFPQEIVVPPDRPVAPPPQKKIGAAFNVFPFLEASLFCWFFF